jgi:arsenical pump membrane protein
MHRVGDQLAELAPALAFLLAAVPLAALLDRLGFFRAAAARLTGPLGTSVLALWVLAAATTVVLNLDTTIVLLTPLYVRIARRADADPLALALVPLLLASLASSVLPVSNLTNLVVAEHVDLTATALVTHLGLPSLAAVVVGWWGYARRHPTRLDPPAVRDLVDRRALRVGGSVVAAVLAGFVLGPTVGVAPWMTALAADVVLVVLTRHVPWRDLPVLTAAGVAAIGALVALLVPADALGPLLHRTQPLAVAGTAGLAAVAANVVNNLPAVLAGSRAVHHTTWGMWAWLLGVNVGAVLLPLGALANLLWLRILRTEGARVRTGAYARAVVPIALPAFVAAVAVLVLERVAWG